MKIYISSQHNYPAKNGGQASERISDLLATGLAELGHEVFYQVNVKSKTDLPEGVCAASGPLHDADIMHLQHIDVSKPYTSSGTPWVRTYHAPGCHNIAPEILQNLIFVSRSHAQQNGSKRFVYNAIDPAEFHFSESKDDYFLFIVSGLERAYTKGLDIVLRLVQEEGLRLKIAASSRCERSKIEFSKVCQKRGIEFLGEISGEYKAEQFAGAKALLFPTLLDESFGLVAIEALVSGTPVICSNNGACPEVVSAETGIICSCYDDYVAALARIDFISSNACRDRVLNDFHYLEMADGYLKEYEHEVRNNYSRIRFPG